MYFILSPKSAGLEDIFMTLDKLKPQQQSPLKDRFREKVTGHFENHVTYLYVHF